jgi:hypothetical protein
MSLALPVELNGYLGHVHVLKLSDQLRLTKEQRTRVRKLHHLTAQAPTATAIESMQIACTKKNANRMSTRCPNLWCLLRVHR